jgi:putative salt-induced outer membrane protein YdiY
MISAWNWRKYFCALASSLTLPGGNLLRKVRFSRILTPLLVAAVLLAVPLLHADTVVLKNGDRVTGTAVKLEGGKLIFKTAYADVVTIAWDQIASLTMSQPMILSTPKEKLNVISVERTSTEVAVGTPSGQLNMDPAAVLVLRLPADQQTYEDSLHPNWGHDWAGAANVSLALARGNSDTATFAAGFMAARATRIDNTSLYANFLYSKNANAVPATSANSTGGGLRYEHTLHSTLFAFGTGDFSSNALQNLDLRSIIGGGLGWHPIKTPRQTFDLLGGVVWTHESYTPTPTNSFAAMDLGEIYMHKLGAGSLVTEQAFFYPDLNQAGQYQFAVDSAFSTKLGKILAWQTAFSDRYTSFPPAGSKSNDVVLTTGLGITLSRR